MVNAFYSPNRNQIGRFTIFHRGVELINNFLHTRVPVCPAANLPYGNAGLFFSSSCFVDEYSASPIRRLAGGVSILEQPHVCKTVSAAIRVPASAARGRSVCSGLFVLMFHIPINTRAALPSAMCADGTGIVLIRDRSD